MQDVRDVRDRVDLLVVKAARGRDSTIIRSFLP